MKVRNSNVLVKREEAETVTKAGIMLVQDSTKKPLKGTVVSKGMEVEDLDVGDEILFDRYATFQEYEGYIILNEADILLVLNKD